MLVVVYEKKLKLCSHLFNGGGAVASIVVQTGLVLVWVKLLLLFALALVTDIPIAVVPVAELP